MRQIQGEIILYFYKEQMNQEEFHSFNHINIKIANVKQSVHLAPFNSHLVRSTSRKFNSVNLTVNPTLSSNKSESDYGECKKKHSQTIEVNREHEIYFNRTKKYNYMKSIIDKYFEENKREKPSFKPINPEKSLNKNIRTLIPKITKSKQERQIENHSQNIQKNKNRQLLLNKRKNKTIVHKNQQEQLHNSIQNSPNLAQKQGEQTVSKSLSFVSSKGINLPPIDQMFEDKDQEMHEFQYESISTLNDTSIMDQPKQDRILLIDSQIYIIEMALINNKVHHKIKTFKEKGQQILKRQLRAISIGVQSVWIEYRYDPRSLVCAPNKSLKELLFKVRRVDTQSKFLALKPKPYYKRLITNNCEELVRLIRQFCEFMKKFQGKILNNKINTGNLFLTKNEHLRLGQWGFASFKQTHLIQNRQFQNRIEPIVKSQKEWFVPPQYLAPQILKAIVFGQDSDLMSFGCAPDIWSLGLTLLQILTVIPVWIPQKCTIFGKSMQARNGLLAIGDRDIKKLLKRQQKLSYLVGKQFEEQFEEEHFNTKIIHIILRCLQFVPQQRPNYDQIIQLLK